MMSEQNQTELEFADPVQQEAIHHVSGPMLLIAGPGSGKTRVITNRIRYLIEEKQISPEHILVVTFTNAAASQMRQRSIQTCHFASGVCFGTFHSVFFQILKQTDQFKQYSLIDQNETYRLLSSFCRLYGEDPMKNSFVYSLIQLMSYCKNSDITYENLLLQENDIVWNQVNLIGIEDDKKEKFIQILDAYQKECMKLHKLDFEDMILFCKQILKENDSFQRKWTNRFQYIMIDEFQDINRLQYEVILLLAGTRKNVFVVGDDDQSIYGFRGSSPDFMRCFESDFFPCKKLFLSINYRSRKSIVQAAGKLIANNRNRFDKRITAKALEKGTAEVLTFADNREEIGWIRDCIMRQMMEHRERSIGNTNHMQNLTIAVLCRTNREAAFYTKALENEKLFFNAITTKNKTEDGYDKETIFDMLAILHMAVGDRQRKYFYRYMNKPLRGIHRISVDDPVSFQKLLQVYQNDSSVSRRLNDMVRNLKLIGRMDPYGAITLACNVLEYDSYLNALEDDKKNKAYETIEWLKEIARPYEEIVNFLCDVEQNMDGIIQNHGKKHALKKESNTDIKIEIMTYHASKGLEFDTVFLPGVNEGKVPLGRTISDGLLEEERRMFYVAMTRAKKNLYISYIEDAQAKDQISVFIRQLQ